MEVELSDQINMITSTVPEEYQPIALIILGVIVLVIRAIKKRKSK